MPKGVRYATEEERREAKRESWRRYRERHPERHMEHVLRWQRNNPQAKKEADAKYKQTHPWVDRIKCWKQRGIKCDDWESLYITYEAHSHCMFCDVEFGEKGNGTGTFKCLDHDHETGEVRGIICQKCNFKDVYQEKPNLL